MLVNQNVLETVTRTALDKVNKLNKPRLRQRWVNAIIKAEAQIAENPYLTWDDSLNGILVLSPSGVIYETNSQCRAENGLLCSAHEQGFPCWHRAAYKLLQRYKQCMESEKEKEVLNFPKKATTFQAPNGGDVSLKAA